MEVRVPDLGDFTDVEVIEVLVAPGDVVACEDSLITLETDKATMEVPSPVAGTVRNIVVAVGGRVSTGDVIAIIEADESSAPAGAEGGESVTGTVSGESERPADDLKVGQVAAGDAAQSASEPRRRSIEVPDLGDFHDVEIIEVLVAPGDEVEAEQGLVTLETDKATMDVPTSEAGVVVAVSVGVGDKVNAGDEIVVIETRAAQAVPAAAARAEPAPSESVQPAAAAPPATPAAQPPAAGEPPPVRIDEAGFSRAHASPSVRKLARELGVDLGRVRGSGKKSRITADDVKAFVKGVLQGGAPSGPGLPAIPVVDFARFGPVEERPLSRIQKISGPRLQASWINVPHVTQHDEADITELEETRQALKAKAEERGLKLTPLAFVMRACVLTLAEFPVFRSSLSADGNSLVVKQYMHIGFAADTPNGLVVPVIRDADKKDIYELAASLGELSTRAREGRLKSDEMQGGVFTISSLGGIGGSFFTPIINAPEVAILGVSRHYWKPVLVEDQFVPRLSLPLSLSYDHRVIDGAAAARFITRLSETFGDVERLLEAIP